MPQVPTYIRQGDWNKYIAIQSQGNWPEFIHAALNDIHYAPASKIPELPKDSIRGPTSKQPSPSKGLKKATEPDDVTYEDYNF